MADDGENVYRKPCFRVMLDGVKQRRISPRRMARAIAPARRGKWLKRVVAGGDADLEKKYAHQYGIAPM